MRRLSEKHRRKRTPFPRKGSPPPRLLIFLQWPNQDMINREPLSKAKAKRLIIRAGIMILFIFISYATGNFCRSFDGRVTAMYICDTDQSLRSATEFVTTTEHLYICGTVEGTTDASATFYLFRDEQNLFSRTRCLPNGQFFLPFSPDGHNYKLGHYRVIMQYDTKVAQEVEFTIVPP